MRENGTFAIAIIIIGMLVAFMANNNSPFPVDFYDDSVHVSQRSGFNLIGGANTTVVAVDDPANFRVNYTLTAAVALGSLPALTDTLMWIGDGSNVATAVAMSGDATIANTGALTIAADSVALTTDTTGNYVGSLVAGTYIDVGGAAEGGTPTVSVDATEVGNVTWGSGSGSTWTFNAGATDPSIAFASDSITITNAATIALPADTIDSAEILDGDLLEIDLKAVDAAADEECLTYEATGGDFEWQACGGAGSQNLFETFNALTGTDPVADSTTDTLNLTADGGTLTIVGDSGTDTVDFDLADNNILEVHLKAVDAAADEECLTYEVTTGDFEWQTCGAGGAQSVALLDGSEHTDTTASAVTRGDLIYGNSSPAWDDLALGDVGDVLYSDGTDLGWAPWGSLYGKLAYQWGSVYAWDDTSPTEMHGMGIYDFGVTESDASAAAVEGADGFGFQQTTGIVSGDDAYWVTSDSSIYVDANPFVIIKFAIAQTADFDFFCGVSDGTNINQVTADPMNTVEASGISFNSTNGDSNFWFRSIDGTTQEETDTSSAVSTNARFIAFEISVASVVMSLFDEGFNLLATDTDSTNIPQTGTQLVIICGGETQATAAKSFTTFYANAAQGI